VDAVKEYGAVVKEILLANCFMKKHIEERDNLMKIKSTIK
jgi:hypothetical protein